MRKALLTLPPGIDDAFDDAWERIERKDHERRDNLGVATAFWVLTATRPLSVAELCEALSIDPNASDHDPEDRPTINKVIKSSSGLVVVESSNGTVRFAHSAVQDWLLKKKRPRNYLVAAICLIYLRFDKFAAGPILPPDDVEIDEITDQEKFEQLLQEYSLLHYAAGNWTFHVNQMPGALPGPLTRMIDRLFTSKAHFEMMRQVRYTTKMNGLWSFASYPTFSDPVHFIVREGLSFKVFPSTPEPEILCTLRDSYGRTVLHEACMVQHVDMVRDIVEMKTDAVNAVDIGKVSTLHFAAEAGNPEIIDILVKSGADLFHVDVWGFTPFQRAVFSGHVDVAKTLLANMLDVIESSGDFLSTKLTDPHGNTLLHQAAALGYKDGVERLLLMREAGSRLDYIQFMPTHAIASSSRMRAYKCSKYFVVASRYYEDSSGWIWGASLASCSKTWPRGLCGYVAESKPVGRICPRCDWLYRTSLGCGRGVSLNSKKALPFDRDCADVRDPESI